MKRDYMNGRGEATSPKTRVTTERVGHVASITFESPPRNITNEQLRPKIMAALTAVSGDTSVRCVILAGAGNRSFCAGADLNEEATLTPDSVRQFLDDDCEIFDGIENLAVPVIAAVKGHRMGVLLSASSSVLAKILESV